MVHVYALYLLALFLEVRAYPLLVRIFSRPGEFPFDLAGDVVTQDLGRILASVSGGDVSGMTALIENERANEYVRSVAMEGMVLVETGQRARDEVISYLLEGSTCNCAPSCGPTLTHLFSCCLQHQDFLLRRNAQHLQNLHSA